MYADIINLVVISEMGDGIEEQERRISHPLVPFCL